MHTVTKRSIASFSVKLMGLFIVISSLQIIARIPQAAFSSFRFSESSEDFLMTLAAAGLAFVSVFVFFVLGGLAIRKSDAIAKCTLPEDETIGCMRSISFENATKIIIVSMGLLFGLRSVPKCLLAIFTIFRHYSTTGFRVSWDTSGAVLELAISLILILRPGWIYGRLVAPRIDEANATTQVEVDVTTSDEDKEEAR